MDCLPQAQDDARIVMLIDDEPAQSRLITAIAARDGWRTIVAPDAETAIAMLGTREGMQLSAILLDQWVPGDDACTLIAELKSRRPALPILMLTTSASPLLAVEAMRAGASDYLVKPVSPDRLMEALRSVTTRQTARDELALGAVQLLLVLDEERREEAGVAVALGLACARRELQLPEAEAPLVHDTKGIARGGHVEARPRLQPLARRRSATRRMRVASNSSRWREPSRAAVSGRPPPPTGAPPPSRSSGSLGEGQDQGQGPDPG